MASTLSRNSKKVKKHRSRKGGNNKVSVLKSLPNDLLLEVIAKVASNSFDDLCRMRQSCKEFNKAGQDDYIFQHVSVPIDKFPLFPLRKRKQISEFLRHCRKCGNAEAMYRQGMIDLFNLNENDFESGLECLKKAAARGHREARYVYGVLACIEGKTKEQGLQSLSSLNRKDLNESREGIMTYIRKMWMNKEVVSKLLDYNASTKTCSQCGNLQDNFVTRRGWEDLYDDGDNLNGCDSCKMNREVNIFCDILKRG